MDDGTRTTGRLKCRNMVSVNLNPSIFEIYAEFIKEIDHPKMLTRYDLALLHGIRLLMQY